MKGKVWLEVLFLTDAVLKEACTTNSYEDAHTWRYCDRKIRAGIYTRIPLMQRLAYPICKEFLGCYLNHCAIPSCMQYLMWMHNLLNLLCSGPKTCISHGHKSGLCARRLSISHHMEFSWSWILSATWGWAILQQDDAVSAFTVIFIPDHGCASS